ncbi:protein PTST homolog 3, chloroplastic isoform X1 [Vigna unguiculata]|uniref:protein PTST homolog 3, chloroplastic isoform X1 n=1 Tax=Vigna unguiculata TaxID=3917 RepID=UPI001015E580|nr:protein PTST homolog 3, chloroplastic isoform X1 [Vigna unguiculata]
MGSVWVCYFPTCTTLPCRHCIFSPTHLLHHSTTLSLRARASQTTTSARTRTRRSRRIKSDAEICNDVREFLASVGLPDDHIPSTKELLLHGWNDLANIVRRRGHKQIQELLTGSSLKADADFLSAENSLDERLDTPNVFEDPLTGQNEKVDSLVDNVETSSEYFVGSNSSSLFVDSSSSLGEGTDTVQEALANLSIGDGLREFNDHAEVVSNATKENIYPNEVPIEDNDCDSLFPNFSSQSSIMPVEISGELPFETVSSGNSDSEDSLVGKTVGQLTLWKENHSDTSFNDSNLGAEEKEFNDSEQKDLGALEGLDDDNDDVENVATISEVSTRENLSDDGRLDSIVNSADSSSTNVDNLANLSLKEKVTKFIQNGDLDPVEDHVSGILIRDDPQESKENFESELDVYTLPGSHLPQDNTVMAHGNSLTSKLDLSGPLDLEKPLWDDHLPHEDLTTQFDKSADTETPKVQNESEINHLKYMLYQKELELSRLKEQIEKEKLALSILQTKAEAEISKARKLISEKDVELQFAEESLSGLKEVQIGFCGDGDIVEVAGSFNGWHHRIKLDPEPSTSAVDLGESRSSRFWSIILWLYPGVYEIKFVVDGKWITDPQRESVTRGHICNNILRVDR